MSAAFFCGKAKAELI